MPETHPLFPSGYWEGFYTYASGPTARQCPMPCLLQFSNGKITGTGSDEVGGFQWVGTYNLASLECSLLKIYVTHEVQYQGCVDENGIWGQWSLPQLNGGFHLWPNANAKTKKTTAKKKQPKGILVAS